MVDNEVIGTLCIEVNIGCPNCGNYFDILHSEDFDDNYAVSSQLFELDSWDNEDLHDIEGACPNCKQKIKVTGVFH